MKEYDRDKVRAVGLFGGGGAGKTTLGEAMLFTSGGITRLGRVEQGNTSLDFEEEEIKRQNSTSTAFTNLEWNKNLIYLVDGPGESNFVSDALNTIRAVDTVLFVMDAIDGVKVTTSKLWDEATRLGLSKMIAVTKLDRELADFDKTLQNIKDVLGIDAVPLTVPVGKGETLTGVADLLAGKALIYQKDGSGKYKEEAVPDNLKSRREKLVEGIVEADDKVMERYLEGEEIGQDELMATLRKGVVSGDVVPLFAVCGNLNLGVHPILNAITSVAPNPLERKPIKAIDVKTGQEIEVKPSVDGPVLGQVVKTVRAFEGMRSIFRVYSGKIEADKATYNSTRETRERLGGLRVLKGKEGETAPYAAPGDIVAVAKLKETKTGDTFCDERQPLKLPELPKPASVINYAIEPKSRGDEERVSGGLSEIMEEDSSITVHRDAETGEFILSGMGQVHIENTIDKLKRRHNVEVHLKEPKVPYRETIIKTAEAEGKHKKQTGGRGQFAVAWIKLAPKGRGEGYEFIDDIFGGSVPNNYRPAVDKGVQEAMVRGVIAGYPVVDFSCSLFDGKYHPVDSSELAFKIAGRKGFKEACKKAGMKLLEPIMNIEVVVPSENMGDIIGDLNSRRGRVQGTDQKGSNAIVKAQVPMSEVLRYSPALDSMTSGRGAFTLEFSHYEDVPAHIQEKIIASAKKGEEEEEE